MGSFSSTSRVPRAEDPDEDMAFVTTTREELLNRCEEELEDLPPPFDRQFNKSMQEQTSEVNNGGRKILTIVSSYYLSIEQKWTRLRGKTQSGYFNGISSHRVSKASYQNILAIDTPSYSSWD